MQVRSKDAYQHTFGQDFRTAYIPIIYTFGHVLRHLTYPHALGQVLRQLTYPHTLGQVIRQLAYPGELGQVLRQKTAYIPICTWPSSKTAYIPTYTWPSSKAACIPEVHNYAHSVGQCLRQYTHIYGSSKEIYPCTFGQVLRRYIYIVQFSSVQDCIYALGKAHMRSTPSLRSFPNVAFETVPMFV